jgi:hypothetical protein
MRGTTVQFMRSHAFLQGPRARLDGDTQRE